MDVLVFETPAPGREIICFGRSTRVTCEFKLLVVLILQDKIENPKLSPSGVNVSLYKGENIADDKRSESLP